MIFKNLDHNIRIFEILILKINLQLYINKIFFIKTKEES